MSESASGEADSDSSASNKEFSCPTCGNTFDTHWGRVQHRRRGHGEDAPRYPELADKDWMYEKYWGEMMTSAEIADILGCGEATPRDWLEKHGIRRRQGSSWGNQLLNGIDYDAKEILKGEMLGDGNINVRGRDHLSAAFRLGTSREPYRDWLADRLEDWGMHVRRRTVTTDLEGYDEYEQYWAETRQYVSLQRIGRRWYTPEGKRVPGDLAVSPLLLRHWYIGDGSWTDSGLSLHTEGFTDECRSRLIQQLAMVGIKATAQGTGSLHVWKESRDRFFEYMADLPSGLNDVYGYKWP